MAASQLVTGADDRRDSREWSETAVEEEWGAFNPRAPAEAASVAVFEEFGFPDGDAATAGSNIYESMTDELHVLDQQPIYAQADALAAWKPTDGDGRDLTPLYVQSLDSAGQATYVVAVDDEKKPLYVEGLDGAEQAMYGVADDKEKPLYVEGLDGAEQATYGVAADEKKPLYVDGLDSSKSGALLCVSGFKETLDLISMYLRPRHRVRIRISDSR